ncbi:DNA-directed RNA polymerase subunit alpha [Pseudomonas oryzihabitans]|nr:DNA-directed RNA polymerase subunit alpha [Pseudomonas psychrotolerans]KTT05145.1 DNA-directed RNA polymerase subunit alpha [Pseudomonas psychrotolerans]KTT11002.1 DNA-directed RNA polymerase subunit alpha [Pseudomonas psychrotolerans]KTT24389.1 DNA-directed RNA polymerase subunit alpha [Pseudomonas psychrotolerans]KTT48698.1 DNA-directed RNA polymerase subunit alpha [Pseudomonas psychrotolerans]
MTRSVTPVRAAATLPVDGKTLDAQLAPPRTRRRARWSPTGMIGGFLVAFWLFIALFGVWLAPYDPSALGGSVLASYSAAHPLGTDYLGRDVLSRILDGARFTVGLALLAAVLSCALGTGLGLLAALSGRWVDEPLSRLIDALISMPSKITALVMVSAFGSSVPLLIVMAVVGYTPGCYRIARSLAMNLTELEYVQVARTRGEGKLYIALVEMLPNMRLPLLTDLGLRFVYIVLLLSGMSFLGLGVQPPDADLGSLVRENIGGLADGAPAVLMPALAIGTLTVGVNLLIDRFGARRRGGR